MKKILSASLVALVSIIAIASAVNAATSGEQSQNQKVTTTTTQTCEQTASGQYNTGSTTCTNKTETTAEQSESQKLIADQVVLKNGRYVKTHVPADTALDLVTTMSILSLGFIGLGAAVALNKTW